MCLSIVLKKQFTQKLYIYKTTETKTQMRYLVKCPDCLFLCGENLLTSGCQATKTIIKVVNTMHVYLK